jgi:hypothetical protein
MSNKPHTDEKTRAAAFAAIRRAAAVARLSDNNALHARMNCDELNAYASEGASRWIRHAIRTAIESDKS